MSRPTRARGAVPLLETPDYDQAVAAFLRVATESLMADADPVYASLRRVPLPEGVARVEVQVEGARISSPEITLVTRSEIEPADVLAGNLEQLHAQVARIADEHLVGLMRPFYAHVGDAAEAVGNTLSLDGAPLGWDALIDAAERAEWPVDASGQVSPPGMVIGRGAGDRLSQLPPPTAQQQARLESLWVQKQEEHVSRRRRRRLR